MDNLKSIAAIISTARRAKGLTQQRLADQIGVNRTTLALWELGRAIPSPENMGKLIWLLDLPLDVLDSVPIERQSKRPLTPAEKLQRQIDAITQQGGGTGLALLLSDTASVTTLCKAVTALDKLQVGSPQYLDQLQTAFNAAITVFKNATKGGDAEE